MNEQKRIEIVCKVDEEQRILNIFADNCPFIPCTEECGEDARCDECIGRNIEFSITEYNQDKELKALAEIGRVFLQAEKLGFKLVDKIRGTSLVNHKDMLQTIPQMLERENIETMLERICNLRFCAKEDILKPSDHPCPEDFNIKGMNNLKSCTLLEGHECVKCWNQKCVD